MQSLSALMQFAEVHASEEGALCNKDTFMSGGVSFAGEGFGGGPGFKLNQSLCPL